MQVYTPNELKQWKEANERFMRRLVSGEWEEDVEIAKLFEDIAGAPSHQCTMMLALFLPAMTEEVTSLIREETSRAMFLQKVVAGVWGMTDYPSKDARIRSVGWFYHHLYRRHLQLNAFESFIQTVKGEREWGPDLTFAVYRLIRWTREDHLFRDGRADCYRAALRKHGVTETYSFEEWRERLKKTLAAGDLDEDIRQKMLRYSEGRFLESQTTTPIEIVMTLVDEGYGKSVPVSNSILRGVGGNLFFGYSASIDKEWKGQEFGFVLRLRSEAGFYGSMGSADSNHAADCRTDYVIHEQQVSADFSMPEIPAVEISGVHIWDDLAQEMMSLPPFIVHMKRDAVERTS